MIITVDGPAGAGKSTVCRRLAERLRCLYLDTGAMYRAVAWAMTNESGNFPDESAVAALLQRLPLKFSILENHLHIVYRGQALTDQLRRSEVGRWASRISQIGAVRSFLTTWQRRLARGQTVVAEGRDMATVVFPDAEVKIFLTADLTTRARRRLHEYRERAIDCDLASVKAEIAARDQADEQRSLAPLKPAPDAYIVDTTELTIDQVVERLVELIDDKIK